MLKCNFHTLKSLLFKLGSAINFEAERIHFLSDRVSVAVVVVVPMRPKAEWAIDSEVMGARGIIVLVKSN